MQPEKTQSEDEVQPSVERTSQQESNRRAAQSEKRTAREKEIAEYAPVVLTGGHGGPIPAFIIWLIRKIFSNSGDQ
jgi:hypothetical protein